MAMLNVVLEKLPPLAPLLWVVSGWGAFVDWVYRREGGQTSTPKQKAIMKNASIATIGFLLLASFTTHGRLDLLAQLWILPVSWLFAFWQLHRWRVRMFNPVEEGEPPKRREDRRAV